MGYSDWKRSKRPCRYCSAHEVWYRIYTSLDEAHEDEHYECRRCKKDWWIDGMDY